MSYRPKPIEVVLPLPEAPPPGILVRRMKLVLLHLYRTAASWLWLQRRDGEIRGYDG